MFGIFSENRGNPVIRDGQTGIHKQPTTNTIQTALSKTVCIPLTTSSEMKSILIFATVVCLTLFFFDHAHADLVAHLTGDDTASDSTGNGHDGMLVGDTSYTSGVIGSAFSFDGDSDRVVVPGSADLEPTAAFSIAMWVDTVLENHIRLLADSNHGGNAGWALQINSANNLSFTYGNGSTFPELVQAFPTGFFDPGFNHVVGTFDGNDLRVYVDGTLLGSLAYSGTPNPSGAEIWLGQHSVFNRSFLGSLDDVRIYNHALSQSEVSALASIPEPSSIAVIGLLGLAFQGRRRRRA